MEGNKDEALRCIAIAQKHKDAGNYASARKFCQKSLSLFETPEAQRLLASIDKLSAAGDSETPQTSSTGAEAHPSASGSKHRHPAASSSSSASGTSSGLGGDKREYTQENVAVVKRVRGCKVTEYYEILSISKDCDESEVKKAYRKVSIPRFGK
jgi:DnaJ family protein B protein 12